MTANHAPWGVYRMVFRSAGLTVRASTQQCPPAAPGDLLVLGPVSHLRSQDLRGWAQASLFSQLFHTVLMHAPVWQVLGFSQVVWPSICSHQLFISISSFLIEAFLYFWCLERWWGRGLYSRTWSLTDAFEVFLLKVKSVLQALLWLLRQDKSFQRKI